MTAPPILYYITDSRQLADAGQLLESIRAAYAAGVDWVQVREKQLLSRELCRLVESAAVLPEKGPARLLVNERTDIALACCADGVHLPAGSPPVAAIRRVSARARAPEWLIGVSCHSVGEVLEARREGASFAVLGPVFDTPGKRLPLGLAVLRAACSAAAGFPVLALGGVTLENARACLDSGAAGLAAIRLFQSGDVNKVVSALRAMR